MVKTGKPALQAERKASSSTGESSLTHPNSSMKASSSAPSSKVKSKLNRFKMTTSILKHCSSTASPRPPEASNGLANGLLPLVSGESSREKSGQRKKFPKDITDFSLFQKRHRGSSKALSCTGERSRKMYSLSEEAGESVGWDTEKQGKEDITWSEGEEGLLETEKGDEAVVNPVPNKKDKVSNTNNSLQEDEEEESETKVNTYHIDSGSDVCDET